MGNCRANHGFAGYDYGSTGHFIFHLLASISTAPDMVQLRVEGVRCTSPASHVVISNVPLFMHEVLHDCLSVSKVWVCTGACARARVCVCMWVSCRGLLTWGSHKWCH